MRVLYITYVNVGSVSSGSGLRPNCMYQAFSERGYDVHLVSGFCGRGEEKQRKEEVQKAINWVEEKLPDYCYIESPTYPILFQCDYDLIRYVHGKKIPMGYFVRDCYRKFPELFPRRTGLVNKLKDAYLDFMQWRTDRILKLMDVVYFPSERMFRYFSYANMKTLPPAGEKCVQIAHENHKTCIYVGGLSPRYGSSLLAQTFTLLNQNGERYPLILVCREEEYQKEKHLFGENPHWLEVHHASGKELEPLYAKADLGLLVLEPNDYTHMAIGTKLFQYLKYGLPVLSSEVETMKKLIAENHFGETAPYDAQAFAAAIRRLLNDDKNLAEVRETAISSLERAHLWVHRVDQITEDLLGTKADS